jgi:hypothetical protein
MEVGQQTGKPRIAAFAEICRHFLTVGRIG